LKRSRTGIPVCPSIRQDEDSRVEREKPIFPFIISHLPFFIEELNLNRLVTSNELVGLKRLVGFTGLVSLTKWKMKNVK
jgi:hypothetical protein